MDDKRLSLEQAWDEAEKYKALERQITCSLQQKIDANMNHICDNNDGNALHAIYHVYTDLFNNFNLKLPFGTKRKRWVEFYESGIISPKIEDAKKVGIRKTLGVFKRCDELVQELGLDFQKRQQMQRRYESQDIDSYVQLMDACLPIYISLLMEGHSQKELYT